MKKYFYIVIVISFSFICCSTNKKNKEVYSEKRIQFLKEFVTKSDTLSSFRYDTTVFDFEELLKSQPIRNVQASLIYVLHSECSVCIGKFLDFLSHLLKTGEKIHLIAIIDLGDKAVMEYYIEMLNNSKDNIDFVMVENVDDKYVKGTLEKQNSKVFYVFKNKIINGVLYELLCEKVS